MNWVFIGSGNGLSPARRQAIAWINTGLLAIGFLETNFSEIRIGILLFSFKKMHLNMSSAKMASILSRGRWVNMTQSHNITQSNFGRLVTADEAPRHQTWVSFKKGQLRQAKRGRHFADDTFKCILLNEKVYIFIRISMKFVPKGPIYYESALVQVMAWRQTGDKPLFEPVLKNDPCHHSVPKPHLVPWYAAISRLGIRNN